MKEGWRRRRSRGTVGSLRPNTRLRNRPPPPPQTSDHSHRYNRSHFSWVFPWLREEREGQAGGRRRRGRKRRDGGLALKPGSDRHYRGAIVLRPSHPFSYEGASRGGAGAGRTGTGRWVLVWRGWGGGVKVCREPPSLHPPTPTCWLTGGI